jgi:hypothetical protein
VSSLLILFNAMAMDVYVDGGFEVEVVESLGFLEGAANKTKFWVQAMLATTMQAATPKREDDAGRE